MHCSHERFVHGGGISATRGGAELRVISEAVVAEVTEHFGGHHGIHFRVSLECHLLLLDENGNLVKTEVHKNFGKEFAHTIGTAYGYIVNKFQMTQNLIDKIKNHPEDRRMIMTLWQNDYLETAVLPSCVWSSEWDVTDGKLNAWVHQRSCDVPLGLPFNVTQYAALLCMLAQVSGLKPGSLDWSIKDAHIYVNQVEGIKEQIKRQDENEDIPAPKLWLNPEIDDFFKFDNSKDCKDIKLIDYKHMGKISFPIAQ